MIVPEIADGLQQLQATHFRLGPRDRRGWGSARRSWPGRAAAPAASTPARDAVQHEPVGEHRELVAHDTLDDGGDLGAHLVERRRAADLRLQLAFDGGGIQASRCRSRARRSRSGSWRRVRPRVAARRRRSCAGRSSRKPTSAQSTPRMMGAAPEGCQRGARGRVRHRRDATGVTASLRAARRSGSRRSRAPRGRAACAA